jgi:hypothetical protein
MIQGIVEEAEAAVHRLSRQLTEPGERECLRCFLLRMSTEFGCDGSHRWTIRWQAERAPRARGLLRRLEQLGGTCDCEVIYTIFPDYPQATALLPCAGMPQAGSAAPCRLRPLSGAA